MDHLSNSLQIACYIGNAFSINCLVIILGLTINATTWKTDDYHINNVSSGRTITHRKYVYIYIHRYLNIFKGTSQIDRHFKRTIFKLIIFMQQFKHVLENGTDWEIRLVRLRLSLYDGMYSAKPVRKYVNSRQYTTAFSDLWSKMSST